MPHDYYAPSDLPYIGPGAKFRFDRGDRSSSSEFTREESVFMRLGWSIPQLRDHVFGRITVREMITSGALALPAEPPPTPAEPPDEGKGQEFDAATFMSVESDGKRSFLLGVVLTNARRLIEIMPDRHAQFAVATAFRVERWAILGNDAAALKETPPPLDRPPDAKPLASVRVELPSLTVKNLGRWFATAEELLHRLNLCHGLATNSPAQPDEFLPASYFLGKFDISDDTLRKAQAAGRIYGEKPHGRWNYSLRDVRRAFAAAVADAAEKRKETERSGIRSKDENRP